MIARHLSTPASYPLLRAIHLVLCADVADDAVLGKVGETAVVAPARKRIKYNPDKDADAANGA